MKLLSKIPKKALITTAVAGTAIAIGVAVAIPKEETYRVIQVYEIDGTAQVTREEIGQMDAYENMQLQSNDQADTGSDSYVQMKMDEDKYLLMEPDTSIRIEATGTETDSKTKIVLTKGAIVNRIEKKLSEDSSYEVETPNSTMAVRGTTFRIAISEPDENGDVYTTLEVYNGSVESVITEKNPDGTVTQKKVTVSAGKKVLIRGTAVDAEYVGEEQDIVFDHENPVLNFIGYLEKEPESTEEETLSVEETGSTQEPETVTEEETVSVTEEETETVPEETQIVPEPDTAQTKEPASIASSSNNTQENSSSQNSGSNSSGTQAGDQTGTESGDQTETESGDQTGTESGDQTGTESGDQTEAEPDDSTTQPVSYTVTFTYNGATFATQTVTENGTAQEPELCPAASGSWSFDFTTPITQNTTIEWN